MTRKITSFENLSSLLEQATCADNDIFAVLSNSASSEPARQKAFSNLKTSVKLILEKIKDTTNVYCNTGISDYKDYCRNFAAYLLVSDSSDDLYNKLFLKLDELLQLIAPSYKKDLRELRREFMAERACIRELGFSWEDLKLPFIADRFAASFLKTEIVQESAPQVVYVEKEVEKVIEKEVEKVVIKEKEIIVEKEKEDVNDFGVESRFVEHKQSFFCDTYNDKPMPFNVCREVCAFLNAEGGRIYIGVSDNGRALPKMLGTFPSGVNKDIKYLERSFRLPFGKNSTDAYCIAVKKEITNRFRDGNDVDKFINEIHVEETKNDNVIVIDVPKSRYCVVRLEGIAYQRSGSECKALSPLQIEQRSQELLSVSKETHFRGQLQRAIEEEKQVILYGYESANSGTIEDRYVEPVNFVCENQSIICYDLRKEGTRQFKLSRIGDVKVLETKWEHKDRHEVSSADIFGWTDHGKKFDICLDMLLPAKTALIENHPNATKDSFKNVGNGYWRLETTVYSLEPVRSFFVSLADSIEIQQTKDSDLLKQMIRDYVQSFIIAKI